MGGKTAIYVKGKVVGHVVGDTFKKRANNKHQLRKPPAWANDTTVLIDAAAAGAKFVEIWNRDNGNTYRATIDDIYQHGWIIERRFGQQWALSLSHWHVNGKRPAARPLATRTQPKTGAVQRTLF